jgi:WD40 repeat protein
LTLEKRLIKFAQQARVCGRKRAGFCFFLAKKGVYMKKVICLFAIVLLLARNNSHAQQSNWIYWTDHAIELYNSTGSGITEFHIEVGPATVATGDSTFQANLVIPTNWMAPVFFTTMWQYMESDTVTLNDGPAKISFPWIFDCFQVGLYLRPDSVFTLEYQVYDVGAQQVIQTAFETIISSNGNSKIYDTLSGQWISGILIKGLRTYSFTGVKGQKIITRTIANMGALLDTTSFHLSMVVEYCGEPDSTAFRSAYPDLPASVSNITTSVAAETSIPKDFMLQQNFPDPFNPSTIIQFTVPSSGRVVLKVFNVLGQEVATLFDGEATTGTYHQVQFNGSNLASGIYFSRLEFERKMLVKKMLLLK